MPAENESQKQTLIPPPPVMWAQRKNLVYLKVALEDCKSPIIKLEKDKLYFKGKGGTENKEHEITLNFYKDINVEDSRYVVRGRETEFVIIKAEPTEYWPQLLKEKRKNHWLKIDFNKWKDEDESDDEGRGPSSNVDFEEMMSQMGGLGGPGGPGPDMDDLDDKEDSDDEALPDLE